MINAHCPCSSQPAAAHRLLQSALEGRPEWQELCDGVLLTIQAVSGKARWTKTVCGGPNDAMSCPADMKGNHDVKLCELGGGLCGWHKEPNSGEVVSIKKKEFTENSTIMFGQPFFGEK